MKKTARIVYFALLSMPFILLCKPALSQTIKLYHDAQMQQCTANNARFYALCKKQDTLYSVAEYNMQNQLLFTGYIADTTDNFILNRRGHFVYYDAGTKKTSEGDFTNGAREGIWTYYKRNATVIQKKITYGNNSIQKVVSFDSLGKLESKQYLTDGIPDKYLEFDEAGKIAEEIIYESGKPISTKKYEKAVLIKKKLTDGTETEYYKNGKLKSEKRFDNKENITESHYYDEKGNEVVKSAIMDTAKKYQFVQQMPAAPYNVGEYLGEHLHYPEVARQKGIIGRVIVRFIVYEDGSINDVMILKGVHPLIDEAALQIISEMPKWKPGKSNGKPVKTYYNQPIKFALE